MISKISSHLGPGSILFSGVSAPSLVLNLDAGNPLSYSPGLSPSGIWYDLTNLDNHIALNGVTFSLSYLDLTNFTGAFEFDGVSSYGEIISATAIPIEDSHYTIESWIQVNDWSAGDIIGWGDYSTFSSANAIGLDGVVLETYSSIYNAWGTVNYVVTPSATFSTTYWYNVAATYDGTSRTIYINGITQSQDIPGVTHSVLDSNLSIGYFDKYFNGRISTIKVWNKNLNSTQLLSAFNSNKSKYGYDFGSMTFDDIQKSHLSSSSNDYAFVANDFTIEAFFKAATSSASAAGVISIRDSGVNPGVYINTQLSDTSTPLIEFGAGGSSLTYTASINEWYHVAISRTSGTSSLFVNGNLFNEVSDTLNYGNSDLVVGRYYTDYDDYYFNGVISNVRVINGTGLYTGTFSPPSVQLSGTESNTKLLITSQEIEPGKDITGLNSVTASNIGWTSSLPYIAPPYITDSLELYVDAGLSYPGSGTILYDLSPNGFDMNIGTGSTWSSTLGGVIDFDGSYNGTPDLDGPVSGLNIISVTHSTGYTMEAMVKFNSVSGNQGIFTFCGGPWGNSGYINLQLSNSSLRWEAVTGAGSSFFPTYTFATETWYHIVATYDGSFLVVYVNGTMIGSYSQSGSINTSSTARFVLGSWDGKLNGSIGFARFYSKPLLAADVTNNFDSTKNRFGL